MRSRKTLDKWIHEALNDADKEGKCTMLSLVHMVGQQPKEIHSTKFTGGKSWTDQDLANLFRDKAETFAQDLQGIQTFQLLAFYASRNEPQAALPFTINPQAETGGFGLGSEPATESGKLAQMMRTQDTLIGQVYRRQATMDDHSMTMIRDLSASNVALARENREMFSLMKEILMEKALNQQKFEMDRLEYERKTIERKKWMQFIPPLVNTVLGREVFPQETADTALIESIADGLTEKDIMTLAGVIRPEMMGPLASRMEKYLLKKKQDDDNTKKLSLMKVPDPEADAAGDVPS